MSTISTSLGRVSSAMTSNLLQSNLRQTNLALLRTQTQLVTGLRVSSPSDEPRAAGRIMSLRTILENYDLQLGNLDLASTVSNVTDQALGDVSDLLLRAESIASSQLTLGASAEERASQAAIIDGLLDSMIEIGNRDVRGVHIFAGRNSSERPFTEQLGGIRYVGSSEDLAGDLGPALPIGINTNGEDVFGAMSSRVSGAVDLDPAAASDTRVADVAGARNQGVALAAVSVDVNGTAAEVDLSGADTLGDVANRINSALGGAGSLTVTADGFTLTAGPGQTITISDPGSGVTAADLGIDLTASAGAVAGADINPRLTALTDVTMLGGSPDLAGGLKITNGGATKVIDFSGANTIQDMINRVEAAQVGAQLAINQEGTGLNLVNEVSGTSMSVGENAGGTTATDLGLRSFGPETLLNDFNHGRGVRTQQGQPDFRIELADGTTAIDVNLDGAATVQDVIDTINAAGGGSVTASLATDGNGLVLTDNIGGAGDLSVVSLNSSLAAADLGIDKNAGTSTTLQGDNTATVRAESVFTHLVMLRDALLNNDERGITLAGEKLGEDTGRIASARAQVGVRANRIQEEQGQMEGRKLQSQSMLSGIQDTDVIEAISRFSQLQQQLQASLQTGGQLLELSLLDFLR